MGCCVCSPVPKKAFCELAVAIIVLTTNLADVQELARRRTGVKAGLRTAISAVPLSLDFVRGGRASELGNLAQKV